MEEEDEENLYAPAEVSEAPRGAHAVSEMANVPIKREGRHEDEDGEEEGEEVEEDESDSVGAAAACFVARVLIVLP